jgi:sec-independent protein translocase protein TatC
MDEKRERRQMLLIYVAIGVIVAVITPSGDAFTLFVVGMPLYMLYEFSILVCRDIDK